MEFGELVGDVSKSLNSFSQFLKEVDEKKVDNNYKNKLVKISELFDIVKGKDKYTNKFVIKNKGNYPLYSSKTTNKGIIGSINTYDYDCEAITWTTDGYAGVVFLRNGRFSMTTHCGALILKNKFKAISLNYIFSYLQQNLRKNAIGVQNKRVTINIIKDVLIPIPINVKGEFDLIVQKAIAEKYKNIEQTKKSIIKELEKISNITIDIE